MILPQNQSLELRQSTLIKAIRFPLIVMVLYIHSPGAFFEPRLELSFDSWNIYHIIAEFISGHMFAIATRCFFLFSGFLFYRFLKEGEFSIKWVITKWKKRFWSLLVPFLFWNLLMVVAVILKNVAFDALSLKSSVEDISLVGKGPLYWFLTGPADFPLWFLRDLILMTLVAPLIYPIFKTFRWASLVILILLYLSPLTLIIPSKQAVIYFSVGAWLGINRFDLLTICRKYKIPAAILSVILLPIATSQVGRPLHTFLLELFIPFGIITSINICDYFINNEKTCEKLCKLSASVFFIYAIHEIYILGWTKGIFLRMFGDSLAGTWISYLLVPVVVLLVCLGLYHLLNSIMPRAMAFACGGRTDIKTP